MNAGCDLAYFVFKKEGGETGDAVVLAETDFGIVEVKLFKVVSRSDMSASRREARGWWGRDETFCKTRSW